MNCRWTMNVVCDRRESHVCKELSRRVVDLHIDVFEMRKLISRVVEKS